MSWSFIRKLKSERFGLRYFLNLSLICSGKCPGSNSSFCDYEWDDVTGVWLSMSNLADSSRVTSFFKVESLISVILL